MGGGISRMTKQERGTPSPELSPQDDCKVFANSIMVSLSNHRQLGRASFDKLSPSTSSGE